MRSKQRKNKMFSFRVSNDEMHFLEKISDKAGADRSAFVRSMLFNQSVTEASTSPPLDRVLLSQLIGQLGEVASRLYAIEESLKHNNQCSPEQLIRECNQLCFLRSYILNAIKRLNNDYKSTEKKKT